MPPRWVATATCSCSTWASRSGSWTSPATSSASPAAIPTASRSRSSACGPGEKLHEELFYDAEQVEPTASPKVLRAIASPPPMDIREHAVRLLALATGDREPELGAALLDYVRITEGVGMTTPPVPCDGKDGEGVDLLAKQLGPWADAAPSEHGLAAAEEPASYTRAPSAPDSAGAAP